MSRDIVTVRGIGRAAKAAGLTGLAFAVFGLGHDGIASSAAAAAKPTATAPGGMASATTAKTAAPKLGYKATVESWRKERETDLRSEDGWLTVAGLFWLKEGANRFGTDPGGDIVFPAGTAPAKAGTFTRHGDKTTVRAEPGVPLKHDGKAVTTMEVHPDQPGPPDKLTLNSLTMFVIQRGDRYGIRLKDKASRKRAEFPGLQWFPIQESYRVVADWVPYDPPRKISIANVLGQTAESPCPGYASFTLGGEKLRLEPAAEPGDKEYSFILRDGTSGKQTYGAGRFLDTDAPKDGKIVLDFNEAYSPPCAFTEFATCPLPPRQNQLAVRIEAGEKFTAHH